MKKVLLISLVLVLGLAASVWADMIAVGPSDYTGDRSTTDGGVIAYDGWSDQGFMISWDIQQIDNDTWYYMYTLSDLAGEMLRKFQSHFIFEVSPNFAGIDDSDDWEYEGPKNWVGSGEDKPNPYLPEGIEIYGIKFNNPADESDPNYGNMTYSFYTSVAPIWGDFYAVDGSTIYEIDKEKVQIWAVAYNSGIGTDPTSSTTNFTPWIAVPDTEGAPPPVPEPSTLLLIGAGLLGLGFLRKK